VRSAPSPAGAFYPADADARRPYLDNDDLAAEGEERQQHVLENEAAWAGWAAGDHGEAAPSGADRPALPGPALTAGVYQNPGPLAPTVTGIGAEKPPTLVPAQPTPAPVTVRRDGAMPGALARSGGSDEAVETRSEPAPPPPGPNDLPAPAPPAGAPLAGLVPFDQELLERSADDFFALLARLGEDWDEGTVVTRLVPWLAAAVGVLELARLRRERSLGPSALQPGGEP
jgi:hypothetical protein